MLAVNGALSSAWPSIVDQADIIKDLEIVASKHPYYKYNQIWTKNMQDTVCLCMPFRAPAKTLRSWPCCCVSGLEEQMASHRAVCLPLRK